MAEEFTWKQKWEDPVCDFNYDMDKAPVSIKWFPGAVTNICYNALDRCGRMDAVPPCPAYAPLLLFCQPLVHAGCVDVREGGALLDTQSRPGREGRSSGFLLRGQRARTGEPE